MNEKRDGMQQTRYPGESLQEYHNRLKVGNDLIHAATRGRLKSRIVWDSKTQGTYRKPKEG